MARRVNFSKLNHLAKLRLTAGFSRKEASEKLKVSEQFIGQIERKNAVKKPSVELAHLMCKIYSCTLEDIYPSKKNTHRKIS